MSSNTTPQIPPQSAATAGRKLTPEKYIHWQLNISFFDGEDNRLLAVSVIADGAIVYGPVSPKQAVLDSDFMGCLPAESAERVRLRADKDTDKLLRGE